MFGLYSEFAGLDGNQIVGPGGTDDKPTTSTTPVTSQAPIWDGFKWVQQSTSIPLTAAQQSYNASIGQQVGPPEPIYMGPPAPGQVVVPLPATKAPASSGSIFDMVGKLFQPITVAAKPATGAATYNFNTGARAQSSVSKYLPYIAIGGVALVAVLMMTGGSKRK
jgi:hypothetical protein